MKNKKVIHITFIITIITIFAYFIFADFSSVSVISPLSDTNYSGSLLLNTTVTITNGAGNATNATFFFYDSTTGTLTYNVTLFPNNLNLNDTFNYTIPNTAIVLVDGTYNLTVNVTNSSNDILENNTFVNIQIDNTNPSINTISTPTTNQYFTSGETIRVNVTIADNGVGLGMVLINISNGTNPDIQKIASNEGNTFNASFTIAELGDGVQTITIIANDTLNNINNSETIAVNIDTIGPSVNLITPLNWTWTDDNTPTFTFNFTDGTSPNATCNILVDGNVVAINITTKNDTTTSLTPNTTLNSGVHSWNANCTDFAGNTAISSINNSLELININITNPLNNTYTSNTTINSTNFTFSINSGLLNSSETVSCELFITNSSGEYLNNGLNSTTLNGTSTIIQNNKTIFSALATINNIPANWTINCTWNGKTIGVSSGFYTFNIDNVTPSITAVSSSSITTTGVTLRATTSEITTCRYGTTNNWNSMTEYATTGGTTHNAVLTTLTSGTSYVYYTRCKDNANNEISGYSVTFNTEASGGNAGGGASSSTSTKVSGEYAKESWYSINKGESATLEIENGAIGITKIIFLINKNTFGAWLKVEKISTMPNSVNTFNNKVYRNLRIVNNNIEKFLGENVTIEFKVEKKWLSNYSLDKKEIALFRYVNNKWTELNTELGEEDETYQHYSAKTPGFSYFIIAKKDQVPELVTQSKPNEENKTQGNVKEIIEEKINKANEIVKPFKNKNKLLLIIILLILIALTGVVYLFTKRK